MDLGLAGRAALVTGASGGLGRAVALELAAAGARVCVVARDANRIAETAQEARAVGAADVLAVNADLSTADGPQRSVAAAVDRFGGLDILVNNVGSAHLRAFDDVTDDDWSAAFEINLLAHVRAIRAALPALRRSDQARIVNVASTAGKRPSTGMPDYSVMKAALLSLSRLIADIEAPNGVLCNAVCPGPLLTDAWLGAGGLADQTAAAKGTDRTAVLASVGAARPLGRMATPEEIAPICALLCSARASYVTGAAWGVDGGTVPVIL